MAIPDDAPGMLLGKTILVGFNHAARSGELIEKIQRYGIIIELGDEVGLVVQEPDGTTFSLPPNLDAVEKAPPGKYALRNSEEVITNPDFLTVWTIWGYGTDDINWEPISGLYYKGS